MLPAETGKMFTLSVVEASLIRLQNDGTARSQGSIAVFVVKPRGRRILLTADLERVRQQLYLAQLQATISSY